MASWMSQFRKGLLELCVLNHLHAQADYGYHIVQRLRRIEGLGIRESTVYPILARLRTEGHLIATSEPSQGGPPRKVFHLSDSGRARLESLNAYWDLLTRSIATLRSDEQKTEGGNHA